MNNNVYLIGMGNKIRVARQTRKLTLAKLSVLCGFDATALWRIEKGQRNAHILTLKSIADVFEMDVKEFL